MGILTYAQLNLRVELKESWYEHITGHHVAQVHNFNPVHGISEKKLIPLLCPPM